MKKILLLTIIILILTLPAAVSQNTRTITINDVPINYILLNNEPYVTYQEMQALNFHGSFFNDASRQTYNGVSYLRLKDICNSLGIISANKTNNSLKIVLNITRLVISVWTNELIFQEKTIPVYIYHSSAGLIYTASLRPSEAREVFLPAALYTLKTDTYESRKDVTEYNGLTGQYYTTNKQTGSFYWEKTVTAKGGEVLEVQLNDDAMKWTKTY